VSSTAICSTSRAIGRIGPTLLVMDEGNRANELCITGTLHGVEIKPRSICT
jgi:hypothetical protein